MCNSSAVNLAICLAVNVRVIISTLNFCEGKVVSKFWVGLVDFKVKDLFILEY